MIEVQEKISKRKINSLAQVNNNEWKKYNKRMDDLIDSAEIEAELEAEKRIRTKNSRLLTISIIGIIFLTLVFIKVQQHSNNTQTQIHKKSLLKKNKSAQSPLSLPKSAKTRLTTKTATPLVKSIKKFKNNSPLLKHDLMARNNETDKTFKSISAKKVINKLDHMHYVQLGAFSIKKNAENLVNKFKSKGFNTVISVSTPNDTYAVRIVGLKTEEEAKKIRNKLTRQGFLDSFAR